MRRIRLTVSYDGTNYCGSQVQPNGVTVEEKLNEAIRKLTGDASPVIFASRTDSGVHAMGNIAVFDTEMRMAADKFVFALNQRLPEDIRVQRSEEVSGDWHPRKQNCTKTYLYRIYNSRIPDPMLRLYSQFCYYDLDTRKMREAAGCLTGEHDFACFCSARSQAENTVRTIYGIEISEETVQRPGKAGVAEVSGEQAGLAAASANGAEPAGRMITIRISGSGFLYNMVRIIAGTLMQIGSGIRPADDMEKILRSRERKNAGPVAGACGLTLLSIRFEKELQDFIEVENEDWSYMLDQRELKNAKTCGADAGEKEPAAEFTQGESLRAAPAAYLTLRRAADRDYEALLTRLLHQNYRNGASSTFVRDLEKPERLRAGQKYGFYTISEPGPEDPVREESAVRGMYWKASELQQKEADS